MRMVSARELIGRTIVAFEPRPMPRTGSGGGTTHDPIIHLDDGTYLYFVTAELDSVGDYGVFIGRSRYRKD